MLFTVLALSALVGASARQPTWRELDNYSFESFLRDFNLNYEANSDEYKLRKGIFETELARVRAHNAKNLSWKEGINHMSIMTKAEKQSTRGRAKGVKKHHQPKYRQEFDYTKFSKPVSELPKNVDWREQGIVTAVKDQGRCGSCWAFASSAVIESHVAKATGLLFDLSPQQIAMCAPNPLECGGTGGCNGATAEVAFDYVANSKGMVQEFQYPYAAYYGENAACSSKATMNDKATIEGYVQLPSNNYTALMNAIATVGPIAISVDASWSGYEEGIFSGLPENPDIDHAVVLVGYGHDESLNMDYWLVRNSWSPSWGEKGYIRLARHDNDESYCGVDITPQDGVACAGDNEPETVCGTSGILFDSAYPIGAKLI